MMKRNRLITEAIRENADLKAECERLNKHEEHMQPLRKEWMEAHLKMVDENSDLRAKLEFHVKELQEKQQYILELEAKLEAAWCTGDGKNWGLTRKENLITNPIIIPAPSMAEVWRELKGYITTYVRMGYSDDEKTTFAEITFVSDLYINENPTDGLIDLLIWVNGRRKL